MQLIVLQLGNALRTLRAHASHATRDRVPSQAVAATRRRGTTATIQPLLEIGFEWKEAWHAVVQPTKALACIGGDQHGMSFVVAQGCDGHHVAFRCMYVIRSLLSVLALFPFEESSTKHHASSALQQFPPLRDTLQAFHPCVDTHTAVLERHAEGDGAQRTRAVIFRAQARHCTSWRHVVLSTEPFFSIPGSFLRHVGGLPHLFWRQGAAETSAHALLLPSSAFQAFNCRRLRNSSSNCARNNVTPTCLPPSSLLSGKGPSVPPRSSERKDLSNTDERVFAWTVERPHGPLVSPKYRRSLRSSRSSKLLVAFRLIAALFSLTIPYKIARCWAIVVEDWLVQWLELDRRPLDAIRSCFATRTSSRGF